MEGRRERGEGKEEGEGGERERDRRCFESLIVSIQSIPFTFIKDSFRILQYWKRLFISNTLIIH